MLSIKVPLGMQSVFIVVGVHHVYRLNVFVASIFQWTMPSVAVEVDIHRSLRHNELRDLTAQLLSETCPNVSTEPELKPLFDESLTYLTSKVQNGARLDVRSAAEGFWGDRHQSAFFDVRVFNPFALSNRRHTLASCYRQHERKKRREYDQRVREIEHGTAPSLPWFFQLLAEWEPQPQSHTKDWHLY